MWNYMRHRDRMIILKVISEINIGYEMLGTATLEEFLDDEKLKRAVSMTVINIGELVKNITDDTRKEHPNIPWKAIAGMRDVAAHKYQTLRMEDVYNTIHSDFLELKTQLNNLIENVRNLMESMKWSAEQAMSAMKVSDADKAVLLKEL